MNTPDLTTVGALVAVIIALSEVVKVAGKLLMAKYGKNPEDDYRRAMNGHQANVERALEEQNRLLGTVADRLGTVGDLTKECHGWHKPEVSPGVKVWWQRPELDEEIANLAEQVSSLDETIRTLAVAVEPLGRDITAIKEEVHDMVLREKYRRGGTADSIQSVGGGRKK